MYSALFILTNIVDVNAISYAIKAFFIIKSKSNNQRKLESFDWLDPSKIHIRCNSTVGPLLLTI